METVSVKNISPPRGTTYWDLKLIFRRFICVFFVGVVESNSKALSVSRTQRSKDRPPLDCSPRMNHSLRLAVGQSSSLSELSTQTDDCILLDGKKVSVSFSVI